MNARTMHSSATQTRPQWAAHIATQLDMVEERLKATVKSDVSVAFDLSMHLFSAGGKRIRPSLVLLSALACAQDVNLSRAVRLAAATELVHVASLVHDDVVDETCERRGVRTANGKWGNKVSVLGGDFMLSKAFSLLAEDGDPEVFLALAETSVQMTESEVLQAQSEGSIEAWKTNYDRIIHGKTATFMGACCEMGALVSGANKACRDAIVRYGVEIGFAFQITDDVLDIVGDSSTTGKDVGADLLNGKFTLPVLLALKKPSFQLSVPPFALEGPLDQDEAAQIAQRIIECGAVDEARKAAFKSAQRAREQLAHLPTSDYLPALESLADWVIDRKA